MDEVKLPLVSIVLISLKLSSNKYLRKSLESCLKQDYVNKNIIVVSNDDNDSFIREQLSDYTNDRDDDTLLVTKGKINNVNVALVKFKKPTTLDEMRGFGIQCVSNIAHIYSLLESDSEFIKDSYISETVVNFIQFPSTVGIIFSNYMEYNEKYNSYTYSYGKQSQNMVISKPAVELAMNNNFSDFINVISQKFIISYLPTTSILRYTNIPVSNKNDFKKAFNDLRDKIRQKQLDDKA